MTPPGVEEGDGSPHEAWLRVLHDYSAALDEQRANLLAVELGVVADPAADHAIEFSAPSAMPPLPAELRPLAEQLLAQTNDLTVVATEIAAEIPARQIAVPRAAAVRPSSLDTLL